MKLKQLLGGISIAMGALGAIGSLSPSPFMVVFGLLPNVACAVAGYHLMQGSNTARKFLAFVSWPLQMLFGGFFVFAFSVGGSGGPDTVLAAIGLGWAFVALVMIAMLTSPRLKQQLAGPST